MIYLDSYTQFTVLDLQTIVLLHATFCVCNIAVVPVVVMHLTVTVTSKQNNVLIFQTKGLLFII